MFWVHLVLLAWLSLLSVLICECCHQVEMQSTEMTLEAMRREMRPLLETVMEGVLTEHKSAPRAEA
jgi:hypothetical protein